MASIDENANEAKRSRPADQGGDGDGEDRISGLCDDVLLRILGLADIDARELVRTAVLSRRWRGLWTRVPSLHFIALWLGLESAAGNVGRYVAFVNSVLAQRARSEASIDLLNIELSMLVECLRGQRQQLVPPVVEVTEAWIRYAVQHHVRRFYLDLHLPFEARQDHHDSDLKQKVEKLLKKRMDSIDNPDEEQEADEQEDGEEEDEEEADEQEDDGEEEDEEEADDLEEDGEEEDEEEADEQEAAPDEDEEEETDENQSDADQGNDDEDEEDKPVIDLDELPSSTKLETMYLCLSRVRVRLPSTAVFASLKNLTIEFVDLAPGSGHLLARLSSSACCPSLQQLRIAHIHFKRAGTKELVLDAGELLQLSMHGMYGMRSLELRTPNLLFLEITECDKLRSLTVSAPALEELTFQRNVTGLVAIHGDLPCVWRLKTDLLRHFSNDDDTNDASICLVKRCSSATSLFVYLHVPSEIERGFDFIRDKIPQVPNVTSLSVNIHPIVEHHSFGDGVAAGLLTRFNNLEYLSVQIDDFGCTKRDEYYSEDADGDSAFTCNHADHWESNSSDISLGNLREACFRGMTGTGCELRFLQMVVASAPSLERVTVSFSVNYNLEDSRMYYFLHTLLGDGAWTACENEDQDFSKPYNKCSKLYKWTPSP